MSDRSHFKLIGTSGSTDYLRDTTAGRRFWLPNSEAAAVPIAGLAGLWCDDMSLEAWCSRCFHQGDLAEIDEDDPLDVTEEEIT